MWKKIYNTMQDFNLKGAWVDKKGNVYMNQVIDSKYYTINQVKEKANARS
jgi:hypothetical protein